MSRTTSMEAIVAATIENFAEVGDSPGFVGASLVQEEDYWHVEIEMNYPYAAMGVLPRGPGRVLYDTERFTSLDAAFQMALREAEARQQVGALSDDERFLYRLALASLKGHIRDKLKFHLTHTCPEKHVPLERRIVLQRLIAYKLDTLF